jgi:hypothetical protein
MNTGEIAALVLLSVNTLGIFVMVFGVGKYFGATDVRLAHVEKSVQELKTSHELHINQDEKEFKGVRQDLSDLKVQVAQKS